MTITGPEVGRLLALDNEELARANPAGVKQKLDKLKASPFVFFRGAGGLFYRDLAGLDAGQPVVSANGDVHPENFGVAQREDGTLAFGLNDFDESDQAPFTFDLRRGATAFELAGRDLGLAAADCAVATRAFLERYARGSKTPEPPIAESTAKAWGRVVRELFEDSAGKKRRKFLAKRVDLAAEKFLAGDEVEPSPERLEPLRVALGAYLVARGRSQGDVKDAARKLDSGTASLGSQRFWVLLHDDRGAEHDRILELKQARASVMERAGIAAGDRAPAERVLAHEQIQNRGGDPFYGAVRLGEESYVVRERSPHRKGLELEKDRLSAGELKDYAQACGAALAQAHARSGAPAAKAIARALDDALEAELARFAVAEADRVTAQHRAFKAGPQS